VSSEWARNEALGKGKHSGQQPAKGDEEKAFRVGKRSIVSKGSLPLRHIISVDRKDKRRGGRYGDTCGGNQICSGAHPWENLFSIATKKGEKKKRGPQAAEWSGEDM